MEQFAFNEQGEIKGKNHMIFSCLLSYLVTLFLASGAII